MRYAIAAALVVLLIWVLFATGTDLVPSFLGDSTGGDRESAELERREGAPSPSQARATRGSDPGGLEALEGRDIEDLSAAELARLARERAAREREARAQVGAGPTGQLGVGEAGGLGQTGPDLELLLADPDGLPEDEIDPDMEEACGICMQAWEDFMVAAGTNGNYDAALEGFQRAADMNLPQAQAHIGMMHFWGMGVGLNHSEAERWLTTAAQNGHGESAYNLCGIYKRGDRLPQDLDASAYWCEQAEALGYTPNSDPFNQEPPKPNPPCGPCGS